MVAATRRAGVAGLALYGIAGSVHDPQLGVVVRILHHATKKRATEQLVTLV